MVNLKSQNSILAGDFNLNLLNYIKNLKTKYFFIKHCLENNCFTNCRTSNENRKLSNPIFMNIDECNFISSNFATTNSDHLSQFEA